MKVLLFVLDQKALIYFEFDDVEIVCFVELVFSITNKKHDAQCSSSMSCI